MLSLGSHRDLPFGHLSEDELALVLLSQALKGKSEVVGTRKESQYLRGFYVLGTSHMLSDLALKWHNQSAVSLHPFYKQGHRPSERLGAIFMVTQVAEKTVEPWFNAKPIVLLRFFQFYLFFYTAGSY